MPNATISCAPTSCATTSRITTPYKGAVLFDLDGTLIDTAPDFVKTINGIRHEHNLAPLAMSEIRKHISNGAQAMIQCAFPDNHPTNRIAQIDRLLRECDKNLGTKAQLFTGIRELITSLHEHHIAWAIITNRNHRFTEPLLEKLALKPTNNLFVCPEHVEQPKPDPEGILLAIKTLGVPAENCLYAGDHLRDIQAANRANITSVACAFGYISDDDDIDAWQASEIVPTVSALTSLIHKRFNIHV